MRAKLCVGPQMTLVLLLRVNLLGVYADALIEIEKPQKLQGAADQARREVTKVRPHSVFQDSFECLWELSRGYCHDPLEEVSFADDATVDPNRWVHLMTTWIFAPSSELFKREGDACDDGTLTYSIYTGESCRSEKEQLEYLRVAGRFVGKLLEKGRILNQRFTPEFYALLLEHPLDVSSLPQAQTLAEARLAEFVGGVRDVVILDELIGAGKFDLVELMHGVAFEELSNWQPHIIVEDSHGNRADIQLSSMVEQTISELGHGSISKLWRLVTGMPRVPPRELSKPQGLVIRICADPDSSLGGFGVNISRRILELRPTREEVLLPLLLEPSYFEPVRDYHWLKYSMERISAKSPQPEIEIDIDATSLLDQLSPIVDDVAQFITSTVIFKGKSLSKSTLKQQFFIFALPRIIGPSCGLFRQVDSPGMPRPTVDLSPEVVADEARHLRHLDVAGLVFGKAIREFFSLPVALSDRLYELICSQTSPTPEKGEPGERTRLDARYAAFVGGIHKVIPNWMLSSVSPNSLAVIFDPFSWSPLVFQSLIRRASALGPEATESDRIFFSNGINRLRGFLLNPALQPAKLLILWGLVFKRMISIEELFAKIPGLSAFTLLVEREENSYSISEGQISFYGGQDLIPFSIMMDVLLSPSNLTALVIGKGIIDEEVTTITAPIGQIFQSFFDSYKEVGEERFIQQRSRVVVTSDGKEVATDVMIVNRVFLVLAEICGIAGRPFAYTLRHGRGFYHIDEGEMEDDEEVHLEKLRLIGMLLANFTVTYSRKMVIPLSPALRQLIYWGRELGGKPVSLREQAFLGGFHKIAPPDAIQLLTCREWCEYLEVDQEHLRIQGRSANIHAFLAQVSRALCVVKTEEQFTTWEQYAQYVEGHTNDFITTAPSCSRQLRDFIGMAFEEDRGLFVVSSGKYILREEEVEDEKKHLQALRVAGLLVGKSIQVANLIDVALHDSIYFCLKNHGIYPDDLNPSELMRGRISAFVRGIFTVVSPILFGLLAEQEIARLFEWQLPLSVEAIRSRDLEPAMQPGSRGEWVLNAFWGAIESFPAAITGRILRRLCNSMRFTGKGIYDISKLTLGAIPTAGASRLPKMDPTTYQIQIPIFQDSGTYRTWLFLVIGYNDKPSMQRLVRLAKLSFSERLDAVRAECSRGPSLVLTAWRDKMLSTAHYFYLQSPELFSPGKWTIKFAREDGLEEAYDAGGVFREWIRDVVAEILGPDHLLFSASGASTDTCHIFPQATSGEGKRVLTKYELAGIIFGKAFLEGVPVGVRFAPIIYMLMLHEKSLESFDYTKALQELDPKAYEGLAYVRDNAVDELDLYFEVHDSEGQSHPLAQDGETIAVTEANKMEYIMLRAEHILLGKTSASVDAFIRGFHATVPPSKLQTYMFTGGEIEHALYGRDSLDVDEWEGVTVYPEGQKPSCELIEWFWAILREFTPERRRQMLFFTTSLTRVPIAGFRGIPKGQFTIQMASTLDPEALPESQTCFSTLKLHPYVSKEKMKEKLTKALDWAPKGFGAI